MKMNGSTDAGKANPNKPSFKPGMQLFYYEKGEHQKSPYK
jgi:hypothetical protein